jgi:hypothetical protein
MNSSLFGLIELLLVFGIVLGLGGWQLWSVRRELARDRTAAAAAIAANPKAASEVLGEGHKHRA